MSFPSLGFAAFFLLVALGWHLLPGKLKKPWLLLGCLAFYARGCGLWLLLPAGETLAVWLLALAAEKGLWGRKRLWTALGLCVTLGVLVVFKYTRFFFRFLFVSSSISLPAWVLPLGISFFSFTLAGYLFDVQKGKYPAEKNLLDFAVFACFFPTLLSGPIERGNTLLPQIRDLPASDGESRRRGLLRFTWGLAKKLVAADTIGLYVDAAYADPSAVSGGAMLIAVILYSFQIYLDFAAYTDMAAGCAGMLGFCLTENFSAPYLTLSVKDFWKKWHISLTSWFREYLYFPLGGSRRGKERTILNILIVFAVSGLWHGAAWTFLLWGLLNGLLQAVGMVTLPLRQRLWQRMGLREQGKLLPVIRCILSFGFITASWILFRSETAEQAIYVVKHILLIFRDGFGTASLLSLIPLRQLRLIPLSLLPFLWEDLRIALGKPRLPELRSPFAYWGVLLLLMLAVAVFGFYGLGFDPREFVYFQF
ncbi:MAG: MBOAT family protein [Oscillospiraceae bacterium]|nr:MBOAT family protein [Oscillospiraceae bacterium]